MGYFATSMFTQSPPRVSPLLLFSYRPECDGLGAAVLGPSRPTNHRPYCIQALEPRPPMVSVGRHRRSVFISRNQHAAHISTENADVDHQRVPIEWC